MVRKWLPWLLLALLIWWAVDNPHAAAVAWHHIGLFLRDLPSGK